MTVQRLKTREQFQAVLGGSTLARTVHFALHCEARNCAHLGLAYNQLWMGAMVPKRWAKRAVTRNLIKRQIYTMANAFEQSLPQGAHVVRLRSGFDRQQFISASSQQLKKAVHAEIEQLFQRAIDGAAPSSTKSA
jgi:ribonuclease P protein component